MMIDELRGMILIKSNIAAITLYYTKCCMVTPTVYDCNPCVNNAYLKIIQKIKSQEHILILKKIYHWS